MKQFRGISWCGGTIVGSLFRCGVGIVQCLFNLLYYVIWWCHLAPVQNSKELLIIRPHCNNFYSILSRKSNNNTTKHKNYFAFCQRKNVRLSQTWRILAQTLKGPGLQITRNRTSRLLKQQWSIKNIWVHPSHNLQRWPWSQVKRKRKMFFKWVLSTGQPPKCFKLSKSIFS